MSGDLPPQDAMDMQCGPLDRSLLTMQDDHISSHIWQGGEREKLDVYQLTANLDDWVFDDTQVSLLSDWGFRAFTNPRSIPQNDIRLITALVERFRPETNTFHFPFGEITITLEDVYMILGLPVRGRAVTHTELSAPLPYWLRQWHDLRLTEAERKAMYKKGGVKLHRLREMYKKKPEKPSPEFIEHDDLVYTRAYLLYIIGGVLFPSSNRDTVHPRYLQLIQNAHEIKEYAWGAAVLSYLFRGLAKAAQKGAKAICGCTMLLQLWSYERLLPGAPLIAPRMDFVWPRALAWAEPVDGRRVNPHHHTGLYRGDFDSFQLGWLTWQPYQRFYDIQDVDVDYNIDLMDAHYMALGRVPLISFDIVEYVMPDRVLRQFGILQHIPQAPVAMTSLRTERASRWVRDNHTVTLADYVEEWHAFNDGMIPIVEEGNYVSIEEYMYWYRRVSKLRIAPFVAEHRSKIVPRDWYPQ